VQTLAEKQVAENQVTEAPKATVPQAAPPQPIVAKAVAPPPAPRVDASDKQNLSADNLNFLGRELNQAGNFRKAIELFTQAVAKKPDFPIAYNGRGYAHMRLAEWKLAEESFTLAIKYNPRYANAYMNRSAARAKLGDVAGSQQDSAMSKQLGAK
jgi:tetratricopeptide (TPR) repeat protein